MKILSIFLLATCVVTMVNAQDTSVETFNAIQLEHSTNPGNYITLSAPTGVTGYSLTLPASSTAVDGKRYTLSLNGTDNAFSWQRTPLGTAGQMSYFETDEAVSGTSQLLWDNTNKYLTLDGRLGIGTTTPNVGLDVNSSIAYREYNFTSSISGTINNYDFTGDGNSKTFIRIGSNTTAEVQLTGLAGGKSGKILILYNATNNGIRMKHASTSSTAVNRIKAPGNQDIMIVPGAAYQLMYSDVDQRWIVAFSGPGEITTLGNKEVTLATGALKLPSSIASYITVNAPSPPCNCNVTLEDGVSVGQILVVQNLGPQRVGFTGANVALDNNTTLQTNESIPLMWQGTKWIQLAEASN